MSSCGRGGVWRRELQEIRDGIGKTEHATLDGLANLKKGMFGNEGMMRFESLQRSSKKA